MSEAMRDLNVNCDCEYRSGEGTVHNHYWRYIYIYM